MKTLHILFLFSFLFLLTSQSCKKKEKLPEGDHTLYCYIDGELFVPEGDCDVASTFPCQESLQISKTEHIFDLWARGDKYTLEFLILNWGEGTYYLEEGSTTYHDFNKTYAILFNKRNHNTYISHDNSGRVKFEQASPDGDTKGTFEFTLYNVEDSTDVIHVTDGHFDD